METQSLGENKKATDVCCPPFDPKAWDDKLLVWDRKLFIRDKVNTFYYMPLNFGKVMRRMNQKVEAAFADMPNWLCLSDHKDKWSMDVYLEVDKDVPDAKNVYLNGTYYCKVYEGPFKNTGKWEEDFNKVIKSKGLISNKLYMWYTTCPKCAKKYGKNYTVFIANVTPENLVNPNFSSKSL